MSCSPGVILVVMVFLAIEHVWVAAPSLVVVLYQVAFWEFCVAAPLLAVFRFRSRRSSGELAGSVGS